MYDETDGFETTAPVGSFPKGRSRYGLDEVIGNVMEWVSDWKGDYQRVDSAVKDPTGPDVGTERVLRGGSWNASKGGWVRPSYRFQYPPDVKSYAIGFRCAKPLK
jgi:formylglycine-generating enzyme required for sulfatase activity